MRVTRWVGVDIGTACVKVVVLQRRAGKLEVAGAAKAELPACDSAATPPEPAVLAGALRSALGAAEARAGDAAVALSPFHFSARIVRMPGAPSDALARAALLEGTRDLPFPANELATGVHLQAGRDDEESVALVAAARSSLVGAYRKGLEAAGVRANHLGASSLAAAAAASDSERRPWVLVDVGASSTTVCYCAEGAVQASRSVLLGGNDLTQALAADLGCTADAAEERKRAHGLECVPHDDSGLEESSEWVRQLAREIGLLLSAVAVQGLPPATEVRLVGGGSLVAGLAPRLGQLLELPAGALELPALGTAARADAAQYAGAYGMALLAAGAALTADLLAEEVRRARQVRQRRRNAWMGAAVALVVLIGGCAAAHQRWRDHLDLQRARAAAVREVTTERSRAKKLDAKYQELSAQADSLRRALRPNPPWVDVMDALAMAAPQGVWVTGIELERGRPLVIRGTALEATGAAQFTNALMESPLLEQVQLNFANGAQVGGRRVTHFGISAVVRGNTAERRVTAKVSTPRKRPSSAKRAAEEVEE